MPIDERIGVSYMAFSECIAIQDVKTKNIEYVTCALLFPIHARRGDGWPREVVETLPTDVWLRVVQRFNTGQIDKS